MFKKIDDLEVFEHNGQTLVRSKEGVWVYVTYYVDKGRTKANIDTVLELREFYEDWYQDKRKKKEL
jgi:hypothetical protein